MTSPRDVGAWERNHTPSLVPPALSARQVAHEGSYLPDSAASAHNLKGARAVTMKRVDR